VLLYAWMTKKIIKKSLRVLLIQVISPHTHKNEALDDLKEIESLIDTWGGVIVERVLQHRTVPDGSTYIGSGKIVEIQTLIREKKIDVVIANAIVNSGQLFRLEKELWATKHDIIVWDRVDLILAIFELHASSVESKLQIELAKIDHMGPRIYGLGGTLFSRQGGGIGGRGLGETNIEIMRRQLKDRKREIQKRLERVKREHEERLEKRKADNVVHVALVGYTNSGKTALFNALTGREKTSANVLFETLDSVTGKVLQNNPDKTILISDTIGFIQGLPPRLIQAFKSTLLETLHADIVFHVIDIADPKVQEKLKVVEIILADLKIDSKKVRYVFNKIDKIDKSVLEDLKRSYHVPKPFFVSAKKGEGIHELRNFFETKL